MSPNELLLFRASISALLVPCPLLIKPWPFSPRSPPSHFSQLVPLNPALTLRMRGGPESCLSLGMPRDGRVRLQPRCPGGAQERSGGDYPGDVASRQSARLPPRAHASAAPLWLRVLVIGSGMKAAFHTPLPWRFYQGLAVTLQMWAAARIPTVLERMTFSLPFNAGSLNSRGARSVLRDRGLSFLRITSITENWLISLQ